MRCRKHNVTWQERESQELACKPMKQDSLSAGNCSIKLWPPPLVQPPLILCLFVLYFVTVWLDQFSNQGHALGKVTGLIKAHLAKINDPGTVCLLGACEKVGVHGPMLGFTACAVL